MPFWLCNLSSQLALLAVCLVVSMDAPRQIPLFVFWVLMSICIFGMVCCAYMRNPFKIGDCNG